MILSGVFQVDREIFDHGIWTNVAEFRLFLYILGKAVWKEEGTKIGDIHVKRGQYLRSYRHLRNDLVYVENNTVNHYSLSQIHRIIEKFVKDGRLETEETELGTLFTVCNYSKYQGFDRFQKEGLEQQKNGEGTEREHQENNKKKDKKGNKDNKENISLQINNLRLRYSEYQLKVIDEYLDILRWTRKSGKIADSVIFKIYTEWEKFKPDTVIHSLQIYTNNPRYHDKKEQYCYGIMRNAKDEEVYKGGNGGGINGGVSKGTKSDGGASEESIRLERIAREQGLIGEDGAVEGPGEVDF